MKIRNYEKMGLSVFFSGLFLIIEMLLFSFLFHQKEFSYQKFVGVVIKENHITVVADELEKEFFYRNKKIYFQGREYYYTIEDVKELGSYYELYLEVSTAKKKVNELLDFSIRIKKESIMSLFQKVWVGD